MLISRFPFLIPVVGIFSTPTQVAESERVAEGGGERGVLNVECVKCGCFKFGL